MAEILSQSQIDSLLSELLEDTVSDKKPVLVTDNVKVYDFKTPKKMSKEQYKLLFSTSEIFARHLSAYLSGALRIFCEISVASVEEHPYSEYNNSIPETHLTGVIDVDQLNSTILVDISTALTFGMIERMLGGKIDPNKVPQREFTEIEVALIERLFKKVTYYLQEAWMSVHPSTVLNLRQMETNARFIKAVRMEDVVEVVALNITLGSICGTLTCCIPFVAVETMLADKIHDKYSSQLEVDEKKAEELREVMMEKLRASMVDVCAILGYTTLPMKEVANLQPGDVIRLDQKVGSEIEVTVNNNKWFYGEVGTKKTRKAIRLNSFYNG